MKELNKLTQRLLAEGWTRDQIPPLCRPWNEWYGGWSYDFGQVKDWVWETPCGLLLDRSEIGHSGYMSYMGVDWTEENDCPTIICPYFDREEVCRLNHPLLQDAPTAGCHYEKLIWCAVHKTDKPFDYERSVRRVQDLADQEKEQLWKEFSQRHNGRVCRNQCRYNRRTKSWMAHYDPWDCVRSVGAGCRYCAVLQKELSVKKGNVFYDERSTRTIPGKGLFPDKEVTTVLKGRKLMEKTASITLCEAIVKYSAWRVREHLLLNRNWDLFIDKSLRLEFLNFRAETRDVRDLDQDMADAAAGIQVFHAADREVDTKEFKRRKREAALQKKVDGLEKKLLAEGLEAFDGYQRKRLFKFVPLARCRELDRKHREQKAIQQMSLF